MGVQHSKHLLHAAIAYGPYQMNANAYKMGFCYHSFSAAEHCHAHKMVPSPSTSSSSLRRWPYAWISANPKRLKCIGIRLSLIRRKRLLYGTEFLYPTASPISAHMCQLQTTHLANKMYVISVEVSWVGPSIRFKMVSDKRL